MVPLQGYGDEVILQNIYKKDQGWATKHDINGSDKA